MAETPETLTVIARAVFELWGDGIEAGRKSCLRHYGPYRDVEAPALLARTQTQIDGIRDAWAEDQRRLAEAVQSAEEWHDEMGQAANDPRHFINERNGIRMAMACFHGKPALMSLLAAARAAPAEGGNDG